jgi:hypothetical protein
VSGTLACDSRSPTDAVRPSPSPSPPTANNPPSVTVVFTGLASCLLRGSLSCTIEVAAEASDPDGDALSYAWCGCATGHAAKATCTIKEPGPVTATVVVDDGRGHSVMASASGEGFPEPRNRPPSVHVVFPAGSQCAPSPGAPCTLEVIAQATDPDDDSLHYSWSGCASGTGVRALCTVSAPGPVTATVSVDDLHSHIVHASATASGAGVNRLPDVFIGGIVIPAAGQGEIDMLGNVMDPDNGFLCGREYCGTIAAAGDCGRAFLSCTCLAGLEARIVRTATVGTCAVTFEVKDKWGAVGKPVVTFDVATLKILSHTSAAPVGTRVPQ